MISRRLSICILLLLPFPVLASGPVNMVSTDVVVPSAGRGPGAADSFWVTDLWVRCNDRTDVTLEFHALDAPSGAPTATATLSMTQPVVYLADVMKNTFGLDSGFGNIRVHSARPVAATLRVYTTGGGGSYGFASMGMPGSMSMGSPRMMGSDDSRRHYMQGLLPQPQARVNVMVANTSATTIQGDLRRAGCRRRGPGLGTRVLPLLDPGVLGPPVRQRARRGPQPLRRRRGAPAAGSRSTPETAER